MWQWLSYLERTLAIINILSHCALYCIRVVDMIVMVVPGHLHTVQINKIHPAAVYVISHSTYKIKWDQKHRTYNAIMYHEFVTLRVVVIPVSAFYVLYQACLEQVRKITDNKWWWTCRWAARGSEALYNDPRYCQLHAHTLVVMNTKRSTNTGFV